MKACEKMCNRLRNRDVYIYGAASIGLMLYENFNSMGIRTVAFIDKRGKEIGTCNGLRVLSLQELDCINKDVIVVLGVKNVFEHSEIAYMLNQHGFSNIIYRPYAVLKGFSSKEEDVINCLYDKILEGDISAVSLDIPATKKVNVVNYKSTALIKNTEDGHCIIYAPIEFIYTEHETKKGHKKIFWSDVPIIALISHIDFFKWANQELGYSPDMYLEFCERAASENDNIKRTDAWRENVIRNRVDVFENMNTSLQRDRNFFIMNAVHAKYNSFGHFELNSGKHRAAFFVAKGMRYLPLRITKSDYEQWINSVDSNEIVRELCSQGIIRTKSAMEYPFLYEMPCDDGDGYYKLLCYMIRVLAVKWYTISSFMDFEGTHVVLSMDDDGYIGRWLRRYGVHVYGESKSVVSGILEKTMKTKIRRIQLDRIYEMALLDYEINETIAQNIIKKRLAKIVLCILPSSSYDNEEDIFLSYRVLSKRDIMLRSKKMRLIYMEV